MRMNRTSESKVLTIWISRVLPLLIYYLPESEIWVKSYSRLNLPCAATFNFECLDIFCSWIGHPSENLGLFEFLESLLYSISSISIYYSPESDIQVKRYGCLNFPCACIFNFEHLDIFCSWIGHLNEKLGTYEFGESFHCSISSVSIYYWPESDIRVKCYD